MGPWAHIRFHLDGGPQGWNPHGVDLAGPKGEGEILS